MISFQTTVYQLKTSHVKHEVEKKIAYTGKRPLRQIVNKRK